MLESDSAGAFVFETMSFVVALRSLLRAKADRPWRAVRSIVDLRTMHVGPEAILIVLGLEFREELGTRQIEAAIERPELGIRQVLGPVTTDPLIAIEPSRAASS